jgi:hypothetical protein
LFTFDLKDDILLREVQKCKNYVYIHGYILNLASLIAATICLVRKQSTGKSGAKKEKQEDFSKPR